MAHVASKRVSLDDIWPDLEDGITTLVTNLNAGFPRARWMELYSNVYNYCTTSRPSPGRKPGGISGANFVGEELYNRLSEFLKKHMKHLGKVHVFYFLAFSKPYLASRGQNGRSFVDVLQ
jgi:hypothetical protein